jgi:SanA protein
VAVGLVIAAMVDYCLSPPATFRIHLALALALALGLCHPRLPRGCRHFIRDLALMLVPAFVMVVAHANITAVWASRDRMVSDVRDLQYTPVGLVFGTTDRVVNGRENLYFRYRIDAAVRVWKAGKVGKLILSGSKSEPYYNEPEKMKDALVERGVPANRITCDDRGIRTLDSVVRAKEIYGANPILFISQRFQNERAIYLAQAHGIESRAFNARDVDAHKDLKTKLREVGARVKMWLDVHFLHTRPRDAGGRENQVE